MSRVLVTNGGAHPPEKWAMTTAEHIFDVSSVGGDRLIQAQKLQLSIAEALMPHHAKVQADQVSELAANAESILSPHNVVAYLDKVMKDILAIVKGTMWELHFAKTEVQAAVREVIANHFAASMHVERLWQADRNPTCPHAQAYKAMFGV